MFALWVRKRDKSGRVLVLPNQIPKLIEQYGLSRAQVNKAVWVVMPDGTQWSGASAVNHIFQVLGGIWVWVARIYEFAPIRWIEDRVYRWIADHRAWLSLWIHTSPEWKE